MRNEDQSCTAGPLQIFTRMRRLAYLASLSVLIPLAFYCWLLSREYGKPERWGGTAGLVIIIVLAVALTIRRLKDIDAPWELAIGMFVPWVGLLFLAIIAGTPGTKRTNRFGDPPAAHPQWLRYLMIASIVAFSIAATYFVLMMLALRNMKFM